MRHSHITCIVFLVLLLGFTPSWADTRLCDLQVEYQTNPLGIDESQPRFNWRMESDRYGAAQTAYQVWVADSQEGLATGDYVYDSGKIDSDKSVGIVYQGKVLQPSTRYYWKVSAWDETGKEITSDESAWFETGLMGSGWNGAKWIGSSMAQLSKYRTHYVIDYDVKIPEDSEKAVFIFGARDEDNYVSVELDLNGSSATRFIIRHTTDGLTMEDANENVATIIPHNKKHDTHHIQLKVTTSLYAFKYFLDVMIDGQTVNNSALTPKEQQQKSQVDSYWGYKEGVFTVSPYIESKRMPYCRLYAIGFLQPQGETATFSNLRISEDAWNTVLYDPSLVYTETGIGELNVWLPGADISAPMLRKNVFIRKAIKRARLYATARGIYEFCINEKKVGEDYFNPGWTDYRYRIMYNTYDITDFLRKGDNGIGVMLGTGWWSDHKSASTGWQDQYGTRQSLLAKILIEYVDGTRETIVTGNDWKCYDQGPITYNGLQNGEEYDARKEVDGWNMPEFDDSTWDFATLYPAPFVGVKIQSYVGSPVRSDLTLTACSVEEPIPGVYVYDMGQNMVGVPRLTLKGENGQEVMIRYGEMKYPDIIPTDPVYPYTITKYKAKKGQVYTDNYRGALSTDYYILKGDPDGETYEPRFTVHGFRYIEIHGLDKPLPLEAVQGVVLNSIGEQTSSYITSNDQVNRLFENIVWGQRGNFLSVPTDCPQRDERMGWTGDAQIFARAATYNMNVDPFYTRWLYSLRDNQGDDGSYANYVPIVAAPPYGVENGGGAIGWMEAGIIVPWQVYQQYGDVRILERHYESMIAYMDFLERRAVKYLQPIGGFGDWLALDQTNTILTNTAYSAYDAMIMEQVATVLSKEADAKRFHTMYEHVKETFNVAFVNATGRTYSPSAASLFGDEAASYVWPILLGDEDKIIDTQTSYVVPLQFDLFDEKNKPLAIHYLLENIQKHDYTLTTGFIGTPYLNLVLSDNGHDDVAYKLFEQTIYPSWLYPVLQGATTIWERWNSYTLVNGFGPVDMNSFNHYAYGAIEEWMMAYSLGIQRDETQPGYKHIILQPRIGGTFSFIHGHYDSIYGRIESGWQKEDEGYVYEATVPANTTATLFLSAGSKQSVKMEKGEEGATFVGIKDDKAVYELKSGSYKLWVHPLVSKP